jgi:hypothetical protein
MKPPRAALCAIAAFALVCVVGCRTPPPSPVFAAADPSLQAPEGMQKLEKSGFALAWMRPDTSLSSYDALRMVYPEPKYRTPPRHPSTAEMGFDNYSFSDGFTREFMSVLERAFADETTSARRWRPETVAGQRALIVRVSLINLVVHAPLRQSAGDTFAWVDTIGDVTVMIDLYDPESESWLARFAERRSIEAFSERPVQATPGAALYESRRLFRLWARNLRLLLDALEAAEVERLSAAPARSGHGAS